MYDSAEEPCVELRALSQSLRRSVAYLRWEHLVARVVNRSVAYLRREHLVAARVVYRSVAYLRWEHLVARRVNHIATAAIQPRLDRLRRQLFGAPPSSHDVTQIIGGRRVDSRGRCAQTGVQLQ